MTPFDSGAKRKPVLDESGFQQLLAAAYVLQQHNDSLRAQDPRLDTGWVLTQVAQTQSLLRAGSIDFDAAANLIANRLRTMTAASGVSISLASNGVLQCVAGSGVGANVPGGSLASHSLVATERLRNGRVFQSADAQKDIRLDIAACREFGVRALLAVPIHGLGEIAGIAEVRWSQPDSVHESDVQACQLMSALVTEILRRNEGSGATPVGTSQSDAAASAAESADDEQSVSQAAADNLALPLAGAPSALADPHASSSESPALTEQPREPATEPPTEPATEALAAECRVCGRPFRADEVFCGNCSMPRVAGAPAENLQSKWASLWYMQKAQDAPEEQDAWEEFQPEAPVPGLQMSARAERQDEDGREEQTESVWRRRERLVDSARQDQTTPALPIAEDLIAPPSWDDTVRAVWTRTLLAVRLRMRRRDTAIVMAASLALLLLLAALTWPTPASSHLTWYESVLVELGLAQVPSQTPAAPTGNPDVRVWVDVHTALYYCPGSNLYGKTPGGEFETQHDAQQDQFEPATGSVCE